MTTDSHGSRSRPVCVLSVGRSGSSLATRVLNLMGVYLGPSVNMMPASDQNALGFWENTEIYRINEAILGVFGGSWYRPPDLAPGWTADARLDHLRERAARVVSDLASESTRRWGFKDPRTVVLLPFWQELVGEMDFVICVRSPHAVIRSVHSSWLPESEPQLTARLWMDVNAMAVARTVGSLRTFVFYEDWFGDSRRVTDRLATFIYQGTPAAAPEVHDAVAQFFRRDLRRADAQEDSATGPAPELDAMYEHLRMAAAADDLASPAQLCHARVAEALAEAYRVRRRLDEVVLQAQQATTRSRAEADLARTRAEGLERERDALHKELARSRQWLDGIQGSTSWRMTAPLRAAKQRLRSPQRATVESLRPPR